MREDEESSEAEDTVEAMPLSEESADGEMYMHRPSLLARRLSSMRGITAMGLPIASTADQLSAESPTRRRSTLAKRRKSGKVSEDGTWRQGLAKTTLAADLALAEGGAAAIAEEPEDGSEPLASKAASVEPEAEQKDTDIAELAAADSAATPIPAVRQQDDEEKLASAAPTTTVEEKEEEEKGVACAPAEAVPGDEEKGPCCDGKESAAEEAKLAAEEPVNAAEQLEAAAEHVTPVLEDNLTGEEGKAVAEEPSTAIEAPGTPRIRYSIDAGERHWTDAPALSAGDSSSEMIDITSNPAADLEGTGAAKNTMDVSLVSATRAKSLSDSEMRRARAGPFALTTHGLKKLISAMDEERTSKQERLATLAELGKPEADVLTCEQFKELLSAIEITAERMIAAENCGPRIKDPENAMDTVLPFFRFADDVSNPRATSPLLVLCHRSPAPFFAPRLAEREGWRYFFREPNAAKDEERIFFQQICSTRACTAARRSRRPWRPRWSRAQTSADRSFLKLSIK